MIWDFENLLSRRLFLWAGTSILSGMGMILFGGTFWQSFGIQALVWGAIDAIIAWLGLRRVEKRLGKPSKIQLEEKEASKIRKLLWFNSALDVVYIAAGAGILYFRGQEGAFWRGTGWGVIIQGAFLYLFDIWHALRVPVPLQLPHLPLFTHPDHDPFLMEGGTPGAVLVHGFPGTAFEMRQLGQVLHEDGWTVSGVRLPGFGPELANIIDYDNQVWVDHVSQECQALKDRGHGPLLLVGFSFGGALAMQVAATAPVDGLVLLAPATWHEPPIIKVAADFLRAVMPLSIQPLRHIPINSPVLDRQFLQYLPEIDLEKPEHADEIKHVKFPLYVLDQVREVGREGLAAAPKIHTPTLLIQGTGDKIVQPERTAKLQNKLGGPVIFETVEGSHGLTMPQHPGFTQVAAKTRAFARQILQSSKNKHHEVNSP